MASFHGQWEGTGHLYEKPAKSSYSGTSKVTMQSSVDFLLVF